MSEPPTTSSLGAIQGVIPASDNAWTQRRRVGDVVVELGFTDRDTVEQMVTLSRESGQQVGVVLVEKGIISPEQLARALAERNGLAYIDLQSFHVDPAASSLLPPSQARRQRLLPVAFIDERTLLIATSDPANLVALDDISIVTGFEGTLAMTSPEQLDSLIGQQTNLDDSVHEVADATPLEGPQTIELLESAGQAPVIKLVHGIIADAVGRGASDVHFDNRDGDMRVRYRIDGVAVDTTSVPASLVPGLISRLKIMADMNIAERRIPQDGRVGLTVDGRAIDLRVATLPVMRGESAVLRILDKDRLMVNLDGLGMSPHERAQFGKAIGAVHGAILVTGPTGAGKTTTLYAALQEVNSPDRTLIAIEDPIEYELDGVKQMQVNPKAGLTFANGLRSMMRADPDVMMVGEIRDGETAQIAIESALTGHLVLSTLHTNSAPMAPARLIEMGIEPFLVASGIECVAAQRLARSLCPECKTPVRLSVAELAGSGFTHVTEDIDAFAPVGCMRCRNTGYAGRIGLYEVMTITEEVGSMILQRATAVEIGEAARRGGMRSLRDDGFDKVRQGITSVPEVIRVVGT